MGLDKTEIARREGMAYAMRIAERVGVDGLKEDLKLRNAFDIPVGMTKKSAEEFTSRTKQNMLDTVLVLACVTLRDEFDFGEKRLIRFMERFNKKADCLGDGLVEWKDLIENLLDETGIETQIRWNNTNVKSNLF